MHIRCNTSMRKTCLKVLSLCLIFNISISFAQNKEVKFAFLTDIHVAPNAPSERALQQIVQEINTDQPDFVILTGDLTNTGSDAELNTVKQTLDKLAVPIYVISGNHETNWSESAGMTFIKLFGNDRFLFETDNYLFIGFATGPYMKMGDGHAKDEDIHWLQQELKKRKTPDKTLIVATHYPLKDGLDNWHEITPILNEYKASFTLCGHEHRLSLHNFDGIIGVMGRASVKSGSDVMGYNLITLKNDSAFVFEKELNNSPELFAAFSLKNNDVVKNRQVSPLPDFSINNQYPHVKFGEIVNDSASIFTGATLSGNTLVYGNSKGEIIAINTKDKQILWEKQLEGSIYSTPVIFKEKVFAGSISGDLYVFSLKDGKILDKIPLGKPIIGETSLESNLLYVTAGNDLYKIEANKGEIIWKNTDIEGQLQGKPTIGNKEIVFGAWDRHLYCVDKNTGKLRWKWDNGHKAVLYSPANVVPAISHNKVFIVAPDRFMTAIDLTTGKTIWRTNKHKVRESMGVSEDGKTIYAKLMNDSILSVSAHGNEFKEKWLINAGFGYEHNPCPIFEHNGTVYAGGKNGLLVAIDPKEQKVIWKYKFGNSSINKITADKDGYIWITLIEGKIIRIL